MGLIGGTGGGSAVSEPFFSDAPGGRLTVSMTEVVDTNTGSEMSDFAIDFFRSVPTLAMGCGAALGLKAGATGVDAPETGGVLLADSGGIGDIWGRKAAKPGLGPPGDGRGETGRPLAAMFGLGLMGPGDRRGDPLGPLPVRRGWRCFDSK